MRRLPLLGLGLLLACSPPGSKSTTTGPAVTGTGDEPTSSSSTGDACLGSGDCDTEGICIASYEAADTMPPGGERGPASCVAPDDCIGATDLGRWCFDHQGCCDDLRCRPADGICEPPLLGQTTGATTTDSTGEPGTGTTGTTGATTTGTGTGSTDTSGTTSGTTGTSG